MCVILGLVLSNVTVSAAQSSTAQIKRKVIWRVEETFGNMVFYVFDINWSLDM